MLTTLGISGVQLVAMRKDRNMSSIHVPAIRILPDDEEESKNENKMIVGGQNSDYHSSGCNT